MTEPAAGEPTPHSPSEPLLTVGAITAAVVALLALLVAFGVHMSNDQRAAILGVVAAIAPLVTAIIGREHVWSPRSVARLLAADRKRRPL